MQINQGFDNNSPQALDRRYGKLVAAKTVPYASLAEAKAAIPVAFRHKGKTVLVTVSGVTREYWWRDGTGDGDLIKKVTDDDTKPYKLIATGDDSYVIAEDLLIDMILVVPTVGFNLKIGLTPGGDELMQEIPVIADQANVINLTVPAWGADVVVYFTGITASCLFLIYKRNMIPINP